MLSRIEIQKALAYAKLKKISQETFFYRKFSTGISRLSMFCFSFILIMMETLKFRSRKTIQYIDGLHAKNLGKDLTFSCIKNKEIIYRQEVPQ